MHNHLESPKLTSKQAEVYIWQVHFFTTGQLAIWGDRTWDIMDNVAYQASFGLLEVVVVCYCASKWFHLLLPE